MTPISNSCSKSAFVCALLVATAPLGCEPISLGRITSGESVRSNDSFSDANNAGAGGTSAGGTGGTHDASTDETTTTGGGGMDSSMGSGGTGSRTWKDIEQLYPPLGGGEAWTNAIDLEVSESGYVYFSPSAFCCTPQRRLSALVQRYIGIGWQLLDEDGAPEPAQDQHRMVVSRQNQHDTVHLLLDGSVVTFSDGAWGSRSVPVDSVLGGERMAFEQDTEGRLYTVVEEEGLASVVRFDDGGWQSLGPGIALGPSSVSPLMTAADRIYLVQSTSPGTVVHGYEEDTWDTVAELPDEYPMAYAGGPNGELYVASRESVPEINVRRWHDDAWTDITTVSTHRFAMNAAPNGELYLAYVDADRRLNLLRWRDLQLDDPIQAPAEVDALVSQYLQLRVGPGQEEPAVYVSYIGDAALPRIWVYE